MMRRLFAFSIVLLAALSVSAQQAPLDENPATRDNRPAQASTNSQDNVGRQDIPVPRAGAPTFRTLDVYIDPHGKSLAVYEFELDAGPDITIVGLEKGNIRGFSDPPYYDPAALNGGRIVVGAYGLVNDLPAGRTHVATLHVRVGGSAEPKYPVKLVTAGDRDGKPIAADVSIQEGVRP